MKFLFTIFSLILLSFHVCGADVAPLDPDVDRKEAGKALRQCVAKTLGIKETTLEAAILKVKNQRLATQPASGNEFEGILPELAEALSIKEDALRAVLNELTEEERSDF